MLRVSFSLDIILFLVFYAIRFLLMHKSIITVYNNMEISYLYSTVSLHNMVQYKFFIPIILHHVVLYVTVEYLFQLNNYSRQIVPVW